VTLTVVLPHVSGQQGDEDAITAVAVFTSNRETLAGPPPVAQSYVVLALEGTARFVIF
jgi:hypothetical protein